MGFCPVGVLILWAAEVNLLLRPPGGLSNGFSVILLDLHCTCNFFGLLGICGDALVDVVFTLLCGCGISIESPDIDERLFHVLKEEDAWHCNYADSPNAYLAAPPGRAEFDLSHVPVYVNCSAKRLVVLAFVETEGGRGCGRCLAGVKPQCQATVRSEVSLSKGEFGLLSAAILNPMEVLWSWDFPTFVGLSGNVCNRRRVVAMPWEPLNLICTQSGKSPSGGVW